MVDTKQNERLEYLLSVLLAEESVPAVTDMPVDVQGKRILYRALVNVRPPLPVTPEYLRVQNEFLYRDNMRKDVVNIDSLSATRLDKRLSLWQGDICRLRVDAIVNAANSGLLGCFHPCHVCIDNAIHTAAGVQLRLACHELMQVQGFPEPVGQAKLTSGFNLAAEHVLHTVGPIIDGCPTETDCDLLASCYRSCLHLAGEHGFGTVAFCCISTGEFRFPKEQAARIAVKTAREFLDSDSEAPERVLFNVYTDEDRNIYRSLLGSD